MIAIPQKQSTRSAASARNEPPVNTRLAVLETRWEDVVPTLATKADLGKLEASITRWMLTTTIALMVGFGGMFFALQRNLEQTMTRLERLYLPAQIAAPTLPPAAIAPQN